MRVKDCHKLLSVLWLIVISPQISSSGGLKVGSNSADYVIMAPTSYRCEDEKLAAFRETENGFTTIVVGFDSVLKEFGTGTSPGTALKSLIRFAHQNWTHPRPRSLLLAGNVNGFLLMKNRRASRIFTQTESSLC